MKQFVIISNGNITKHFVEKNNGVFAFQVDMYS